MSKINNITVDIGLATLAIPSAAFNLPLVVGIAKPGSYTEITESDELLGVGYTVNDPEYKMSQAIFSQSPRMQTVAVSSISNYANLATELAELRNTGKDGWYYLLIASRNKENISIADTYINSLEKMGFFATSDQTITSNGERTVVLISNNSDKYPEAAWVGRCGAVQIGKISWDAKTLNGQNASTLTQSQQTSILAKNFNIIAGMGKNEVTYEGKTASGQYIDIINARDYLKARLSEEWYSLKINNDKVPFDKDGRSLIESALRSVFMDCGKLGIISKAVTQAEKKKSDMGEYQYKLNVPLASEVSFVNRANRLLTPVTFDAVISGSVNKMEVKGTLTV